MIVQTSMVYLFALLFACLNESNMDKKSTKNTLESPASKSTKSVLLGQTPSPLNTKEILPEDFSEDLIQKVSLSTVGFDKTVAISNLLRGPCIDDWQKGNTLNQSLLEGKCQKSLAWFKAAQRAVNKGTNSEDILFTLVAPGPYIDGENSEFQTVPMVIATIEQSQLEIFTQRVTFIEAASSTAMVILIDLNGELLKFDRNCLLNGQKMTIAQAKNGCKWQTVQGEIFDLLSEQRLVWIINGYSVTGFRSTTQLQSMLNLP